MSVVSGGTVSAPGYAPIIITKTVSNDAGLAAAAAAAGISTGTPTATVSTSTSNVNVATVLNRDGSSSYGVINSSGSTFTPNVAVTVSGATNQPTGTVKPSSGIKDRYANYDAEKKAEAELQIEEELYQDMDLIQGGSDSGGLIIIVSVVILGLIGTVLLTLHMIQQNKHKRILEANMREQAMADLSGKNVHNSEDFADSDCVAVKSKNRVFINKLKQGDHLSNPQ